MNPKFYYDVIETSLGWIGILGSSRGLRKITLPQNHPKQCLQFLSPDIDMGVIDASYFKSIAKSLSMYFDGMPVSFEEDLIDVQGASKFQKLTWQACRTIPIGETRSYKWLAVEMGNPAAIRAVGQAMAKNWLAILVPCHRVLGIKGNLVGFGGKTKNTHMKHRLLELESTMKTRFG